jgi:uncharacterized protein (DUF433 family)/antitoxin component of MazEF toxin-antitoxin module
MNTGYRTKIVKVGNSRGVRIPRNLLEEAGLENDVEISAQGNRLVIRPVKEARSEAAQPPMVPASIVMDELGRPLIGGTTMKVVELVAEHIAYGWSPEELKYQHPYLSMGQVHAALAYYWDHQGEIEAEIERLDKEAERLRAASDSPLRARLKAEGLI